MGKPKTPDEELENERHRLAGTLEDGIRSMESGQILTKDELRQHLKASRDPQTSDPEMEEDLRRLDAMLQEGLDDIDAGRIVTLEHMRERLDALRANPVKRADRRIKRHR
jgi:predicted transcriptional regulator